MTLINDSLSSNFLGTFISSSWIYVHSRIKNWLNCVNISCHKMNAPRKSLEGWPFTFWPKMQHVASGNYNSLWWVTYMLPSLRTNLVNKNMLHFTSAELSFHLPLEYEVGSLYIENIQSYYTTNNGLFMSHNDLNLQTGKLKLYEGPSKLYAMNNFPCAGKGYASFYHTPTCEISTELRKYQQSHVHSK